MSPPAWALQVDNFDPAPHEELICSICQCVFCEPVECPCRHVFCTVCINKWICMHRSCPICRTRTSMSSLRPVNRIISNLIMGLTLRCKNYNFGCGLKITLESVNAHIKVCAFELEDCPNGCGKLIFRTDMEQHVHVDCPFRCIKCDTCGLNIEDLTADHNCIKLLLQCVKEKEKEIIELKEELKKLKTSKEQENESGTQAANNSDLNLQMSIFSSCSSDSDDTSLLDDSLQLHSHSSSSLSDPETDDSFSLMVAHIDTSDAHLQDDVQHENNSSPSPQPTFQELDLVEMDASTEVQFHSPLSDASASNSEPVTNKRLRLELQPSPLYTIQVHPDALTNQQDPSTPLSGMFIPTLSLTFDSPEMESSPSPADPNSEPEATAGPSHEDSAARLNASVVSIFRRTLSLLKKHTNDSDPEWLPNQPSNSSDSDVSSLLELDSWINSDSDDSSSRNSTTDLFQRDSETLDEVSQSSYEVEVPTPTYDLLERYGSETDTDDPDWMP